jgi:uncharacterized membrane protein
MKKKLLFILILMVAPFFTFAFGMAGAMGQANAMSHAKGYDPLGHVNPVVWIFLLICIIVFCLTWANDKLESWMRS